MAGLETDARARLTLGDLQLVDARPFWSSEVWQPKVVRYALPDMPHEVSPLQRTVWEKLRTRIASVVPGMTEMALPSRGEQVSLEDWPNILVTFQDGTLNPSYANLDVVDALPSNYRSALKVLGINVVPHIPDGWDFHQSRRQLGIKQMHNALVLEGDPEGSSFGRMLRVSLAGNWKIEEGTTEQLLDRAARWLVNTMAAPEITGRTDYQGQSLFTFDELITSVIPLLMAQSAKRLGDNQVIENEIDLPAVTRDERMALLILKVINKGVSESMQAAFDQNLGIMIVTPTGAEKVNIDPDPMKAKLTPISHMIPGKGFIVMRPDGAPDNIAYANPSVETNETALGMIVARMIKDGQLTSFADFLAWYNDAKTQGRPVEIIRRGEMAPYKYHQHLHRQVVPDSFDPSLVEVVDGPDRRYFSKDDFPCGSEPAALAFISSLFQSRQIMALPRIGKIPGYVALHMDGHGMIIIGNDREEMDEVLIHGLKLREPIRV